MEKKYKYITIKERKVIDNKKMEYNIVNNKSGTVLGYLFYYSQWKQYVFTQADSDIIFNKSCLLNIVDFIENVINDKLDKIADEIIENFK